MTDAIRVLVRDLLDFGVLCDRLLKGEGSWYDEDDYGEGVLDRARVFLAAEPPSPVAVPTPDDFRRWWRETGSNDSGPTPEMLLTANAWAEAWAAMREPAPAPAKPVTLVPVAEQPGPEDCDAQGRCWWLVPNQSWPCLYLMKADSALAASVATHWLPHWAIPATQAARWGPA